MRGSSTRAAGSGPANVPASGLVFGLVFGLLIGAAVLLGGCELLTESDTEERHGLEWARGIADAVAERELGDSNNLTYIIGGLMDNKGYLDPIDDDCRYYFSYDWNGYELYVTVYHSGMVEMYLDDYGSTGSALPEYNDQNVRDWIETVSEVYRQLSGRSDDTLYRFYITQDYYSDGHVVYISLYKIRYDDFVALASIYLGIESGIIHKIHLY